jgi:hypothetical protein
MKKKIVTVVKVGEPPHQPTPLRELIRQQSDAMRAIHHAADIFSKIEEANAASTRHAARCQ